MPVMTARTGESVEQVQETWRRRIQQARDARRPFEPGALTNLAFAAGQHWLVWDYRQRQLRHISDVDPRYETRELYTADRITELRSAQIGELSSEDERPQLLAAQDGDDAADVVAELNAAVSYCWEHEWRADSAIRRARTLCLDLGVAAIRCRWDPSRGPIISHVPVDPEGQPIRDGATLAFLEEHGTLPDGSLPRFKAVQEGRSVWEPYSFFQLLVPPGVVHEDQFPWEVLVRAAPLEQVEDEYGVSLTEDTDIASALGLSASQQTQTGQPQENRLRDHVWLYTCFQRPTPRYPQGRVAVIASNAYQLLDLRDELPYTLSGEPHTGIVYLHWRRLSDRFYSNSFVSGLKDPQRLINRRKTQNLEIIDRGMRKSSRRKVT